MTREIAAAMLENIYRDLEEGDTLTLAFQGGEPTIAGLDYFEYITDVVAQQKTCPYQLRNSNQWCHD